MKARKLKVSILAQEDKPTLIVGEGSCSTTNYGIAASIIPSVFPTEDINEPAVQVDAGERVYPAPSVEVHAEANDPTLGVSTSPLAAEEGENDQPGSASKGMLYLCLREKNPLT